MNTAAPQGSATSGRWRAVKWLLGLGGIVALAGVVIGQSAQTPPNIPAISLSSEPLYARGVRAKPTLTLDLSVEFPTVGASYVNSADASNDGTYSTATEYVGYFDPNGCYSYDKTNSYFTRTGAASSHTCSDAFSGNFMNWATTSAIDILRYGLTGGDRITDTASLTVLQRAVIPSWFYNSSNFPSKKLVASLAAGAVPSALRGTYTGDIYIANCLNQIYFGTAKAGSCGNAGANGNLGTPTVPSGSGLTSDYVWCANENSTCNFTGTYTVAYGANGTYNFKTKTNGVACTNNSGDMGPDPLYGVGKACYVRSGTTTTALTNDNFFYARVAVCDTSSGSGGDAASRSNLCLKYPNNNFKPVGNLQKYSDRMRVSVFGYLMDNTLSRYGGVLRAPMKYVGQKQYDSNFNLLSAANPNQEWDPTTGVFVADPGPKPSGETLAISGVINYVNQFGRTGTAGTYKTYDPVGELYYESMRYIQGLSPTPDAVSNITAAMKDGFPVYSTWTDPHPAITNLSDYSCVRNNMLVIGDIHTHADRYIPGNTITTSYDNTRAVSDPVEPDFMKWTNVVGAFESNTSMSYTDGAGVSRTTSNPNSSQLQTDLANLASKYPPCCNYNGYYMAGVAYWARTHDIRPSNWSAQTSLQRPGMRATTYVIDVNENGDSTSTSQLRRNQFYLAAKYGGFDADKSLGGNPYYQTDGTVNNDLWATTGTPDAKNYFLANQAQKFLSALDNIFANIASEAASIAGASVSAKQVTSTDASAVFQANFDPVNWTGDVVSTALTYDSANSAISISNTPNWSAANQLALKSAASRNIVVGRTTVSSGQLPGVDFQWSTLPADEQIALGRPLNQTNTSALSTAEVTYGQQLLAYLRGDDSYTSAQGWRQRPQLTVKNATTGAVIGTGLNKLGDIVNSGVVYKGAPTRRISDSSYSSFYSTYAGRTAAVYVGANDGMLHAFKAINDSSLTVAGGDELFAYIPSFVVPNLYQLAQVSYTHRSYVDATPAVGEAQVGSSWKTVLVSGAGGGAQGLFALDVSDPTNFSASKVLWEFSDRDDADLGNVIGRPQILKFRTSAANATTPTYKWYAVVASGVNNYTNSGGADTHFSSTGNPALFILDLSKAATDAWQLGVNYYKVVLPNASTSAKGAIGFSARGGNAGEVTQIYMGDLQGNLWKLNFANQTPSTWDFSHVAAFGSTPLFQAVGTTNNVTTNQPISMEPALAYGPNGSIIVMFGTGKYIEDADNQSSSFTTQSVYAVLDDGVHSVPGKSYLKQVTVSASAGTLTGSTISWGYPASSNDQTLRAGWYFDYPNSAAGERQISGFTLFGTQILFGSIVPPGNGCDAGGGYVYAADLTSGSGSFIKSDIGIQGEPFVIRTGTSTLTISTSTGARTMKSTAKVVRTGSNGLSTASNPSLTQSLQVGRLSWREIANYQAIRNQP